MNKVHIVHSWGGKSRKGFYSDMCERVNNNTINYSQATDLSKDKDPFEYVCLDLLEHLNNINYEGHYDFIFIDEAQDFGINFFKLCLKTLRQSNLSINNFTSGFLIYAYDELQSLRHKTKIPSKKKFLFKNIYVKI